MNSLRNQLSQEKKRGKCVCACACLCVRETERQKIETERQGVRRIQVGVKILRSTHLELMHWPEPKEMPLMGTKLTKLIRNVEFKVCIIAFTHHTFHAAFSITP